MNGMNPLFAMFGNQINNTPVGNMMNMVSQAKNFINSFNGTPQTAQQQVQQMLNNGQLTQSQLNDAANKVNQLMGLMNN